MNHPIDGIISITKKCSFFGRQNS